MQQIIIVIKDGNDYKISETSLIKDYLKLKYIPDTDRLLDWRFYLMKCEIKSKIEENNVKLEILAVDYLLTLKQKKK